MREPAFLLLSFLCLLSLSLADEDKTTRKLSYGSPTSTCTLCAKWNSPNADCTKPSDPPPDCSHGKCTLCESCPLVNCSGSQLWKNETHDRLIYVQAEPTGNTKGEIDYLWSTIGSPSLVVSFTTEDPDLSTNWTIKDPSPNTESSVDLEDIQMKSDFSFGVIISRIFTFTDSKLNLSCAGAPGGLDGCNNITFDINADVYPGFAWQTFNRTQSQMTEGMGGQLNGSLPHDMFPPHSRQSVNDTGIWLHLECSAAKEAGAQIPLPHLPYSVNSTLLDFKLNLSVSYTKKNDESVVVEMVVVPDPQTAKNAENISAVKSIDDEYTPSIFTTFTSHIVGHDKSHAGYVQWKPIAYIDPVSHTVENSFQIYMQPDRGTLPFNGSLPYSAVSALYGPSANNTARVFYIVFHPQTAQESNPTFYSWSLVLGYGTPEPQKASLLVYLTIGLGLGVPLVLTLLSGVYVVHKKRQISKERSRSSSPYRVN